MVGKFINNLLGAVFMSLLFGVMMGVFYGLLGGIWLGPVWFGVSVSVGFKWGFWCGAIVGGIGGIIIFFRPPPVISKTETAEDRLERSLAVDLARLRRRDRRDYGLGEPTPYVPEKIPDVTIPGWTPTPKYLSHVVRQYGLSRESYLKMYEAQGRKCAINGCDRTGKLVVDHDHVTGKVRGLLCGPCNTRLGHLGDIFQQVTIYLKKEEVK
jgi:hypothetical protein